MPYFPPAGGGGGQLIYDVVIEPGDDIAAAFSALNTGDTVLIKNGTHTLTNNAIITASGVTVYGQGQFNTDIYFASYNLGVDNGGVEFYNLGFQMSGTEILYASGDTVFDGCRVNMNNVQAASQLFAGLSGFPSGLRVRNCYITIGTDGTPATQPFCNLANGTNIVFENNYISINPLDNFDGASAYPAFTFGSQTAFTKNNVSYENVISAGSILFDFTSVNGFYNIEGNTFTQTVASLPSYTCRIGSPDTTFANNQLKFESSALLVTYGTANRIITGNTFLSFNAVAGYNTIQVDDSNPITISNNQFYGGSSVTSAINFVSTYNAIVSDNEFETYEYGISFTAPSASSQLNATGNKFQNIFTAAIQSVSGSFFNQQTANLGVKIEQDKVFYRAVNNSGSQIDEGSPVFAYYNGGQIEIENNTYFNFPNWLGVACESIANGYEGWIQVSGEGRVAIPDNLAVLESERLAPTTGPFLTNYIFDNAPQNLQFARAMETYAGGGGGSAVYLLKAQIYPQYSLTTENLGQTVFDAIVAPSGGDYTTLGAAIAAASAGWTILVRPGIYTENDIIHSVSNLTIVGSGIGNTELSFASNQSYNDSGSNGLNLSNLTMTFNGGYAAFYGDKTILNNLQINVSSTPTLSTPLIIAGDDGLFTNLIYNDTVAAHNLTAVDVTGSRNRFNNCTFNINIGGYTSFSNRAIDTENTNYSQFYNCVFNITNAPNVGCSILFHNNTTALIVDNCIFDNATPSDEYAIYDNNSTGSKITNSVFKNFGYALYVQSGTGDTLVEANQITSTTTTGIGIDVDYTIGTIITSNKITLGGGTSTGIRLWNAGNNHSLDNNVIDNVGTGILVDTGVIAVMLGTNNISNAAVKTIDNLGTGTNIVNRQNYDAVVAPSGGDYTTLSDALTAASSEWRILVKPGTYTEAGAVSPGQVYIEGWEKDNVALNFDTNDITFSSTDVIKNLTINLTTAKVNFNGANIVENVSVNGNDVPTTSHILIDAPGGVFNELVYSDNSTSPTGTRVDITGSGNNLKFTDCNFNINLDAGVGVYVGGIGVKFVNCDFVITNHNLGGDLVELWGNNIQITNCRFYDSSSTNNVDLGIYDVGGNNTVSNCTFSNINVGVYADGNYDCIYNGNVIKSSSTSATGFYLAAASYCSVIGNTISFDTTGTNKGIDVVGTVSNSVFNSNKIFADDGIIIGSATNVDNMVCTNHLVQCGTPFTDNGTGTFDATGSNFV